MTFYKIYNPKTKLYSNGGVYLVKWGREGKIWHKESYLKSHLTQLKDCGKHHGGINQYDGCNIVILDVNESIAPDWLSERLLK